MLASCQATALWPVVSALLLIAAELSESFKLNISAFGIGSTLKDTAVQTTFGVKLPLRPALLTCQLVRSSDDIGHVALSWELVSTNGQKTPAVLARSTDMSKALTTKIDLNLTLVSQTVQCVARLVPRNIVLEWKTITVQALGGLTAWAGWTRCTPACGIDRRAGRARTCFNPQQLTDPGTATCYGARLTVVLLCASLSCATVQPISAYNSNVAIPVVIQRTEESNLRVIVACSSGLIGSLLLSAVLACWRRLYLEQLEQQRQLLRPEATEPRYHGLNEQRAMRTAPPPTYHETFHIDISRVQGVGEGSPSSSAPRSASSSPANGSLPAALSEPIDIARDENGSANGSASNSQVVAGSEHGSQTSRRPSSLCSGATGSAASGNGSVGSSSLTAASPPDTTANAASSPVPSAVTNTSRDTPAEASSAPAAPGDPEPIDVAQRSAQTYDYLLGNLRSGIIDDECPLDDEEDGDQWSVDGDSAPLFVPS